MTDRKEKYHHAIPDNNKYMKQLNFGMYPFIFDTGGVYINFKVNNHNVDRYEKQILTGVTPCYHFVSAIVCSSPHPTGANNGGYCRMISPDLR